jgi:hypothetical protein
MQLVLRAKYLPGFAIVLVCSLMLSCGGSSQPKPLTVTISPSPATLGVNASLRMSLQTNPELPPYTHSITWSIQEYQDSTRCTEERLDSNVSHPIADCPYGWLEITSPVGERYDPIEAYYYSPEAAGVWHVTVDASINNGTQYQGRGAAVVTVTNP